MLDAAIQAGVWCLVAAPIMASNMDGDAMLAPWWQRWAYACLFPAFLVSVMVYQVVAAILAPPPR